MSKVCGDRSTVLTFLPIDQIVVVLHADEFVPAMFVCNVLQHLELPSFHLRDVNVRLQRLDGSRTLLAPMYLTFPLSTTSFNALITSSFGVSRSSLWICKTSM